MKIINIKAEQPNSTNPKTNKIKKLLLVVLPYNAIGDK